MVNILEPFPTWIMLGCSLLRQIRKKHRAIACSHGFGVVKNGVLYQASSKTQRPTLIQALRSVRDGQLEVALTPSTDMRRYYEPSYAVGS